MTLLVASVRGAVLACFQSCVRAALPLPTWLVRPKKNLIGSSDSKLGHLDAYLLAITDGDGISEFYDNRGLELESQSF